MPLTSHPRAIYSNHPHDTWWPSDCRSPSFWPHTDHTVSSRNLATTDISVILDKKSGHLEVFHTEPYVSVNTAPSVNFPPSQISVIFLDLTVPSVPWAYHVTPCVQYHPYQWLGMPLGYTQQQRRSVWMCWWIPRSRFTPGTLLETLNLSCLIPTTYLVHIHTCVH